MTSNKATRPAAPKSTSRAWQVGLAASLLLTASPLALHAETSNAELAREIAELKAQLRSLKGSVAETRRATRTKTVVVPAPLPVAAAAPPGAVPVFATADKKLIFGNLTITPGGYLDINGIVRSRNNQADVTTSYASIPTLNNDAAHVSENRFSIKQSRAALLIEAPITPNYLVAGYAEVDFNAAGTTTNYTQTDSFTLRVRHAYATLDSSDYGFHVLAGQNWSLITVNSKGITPRNEVLTPGLDSGVQVGYDYARAPQIRIVKDFDKKLWLALSAEDSGGNSNTNGICGAVASNTAGGIAAAANGGIASINSVAANAATGILNGTCVVQGNGSLGQQGQNSSTQPLNRVPTVIGKVAYEARLFDRDVHLEAAGIYQNFTDYINYGTAVNPSTGFNGNSIQNNRSAPAVEAAIIAAVIPKKLDFQFSGYFGRGLGRYTSSGIATATVDGNGRIIPLLGASANVGLIYHATSAFDLYAFAGFDQVNRDFSIGTAGAQAGYGTTGGVNNSGCNSPGGTCQGQNHRVLELTAGFNDKIYKGQFGEVRVGVQYEYVQRQLFGATANANGVATAGAPFISARTTDHVVFTSLRYFPFQ